MVEVKQPLLTHSSVRRQDDLTSSTKVQQQGGRMASSSNDGLNLLVEDHKNVLYLYYDVFLTADNMTEKSNAMNLIFEELSRHMSVEEQIVYPLVPRIIDRGVEIKQDLIQEHSQLKRIMIELMDMDIHDIQYLPLCDQLMRDFRHHSQKEQKEVINELRLVMNEYQLDLLYQCLGSAKSVAPCTPYFQSPDESPASWLIGSVSLTFDILIQDLRKTKAISQ